MQLQQLRSFCRVQGTGGKSTSVGPNAAAVMAQLEEFGISSGRIAEFMINVFEYKMSKSTANEVRHAVS